MDVLDILETVHSKSMPHSILSAITSSANVANPTSIGSFTNRNEVSVTLRHAHQFVSIGRPHCFLAPQAWFKVELQDAQQIKRILFDESGTFYSYHDDLLILSCTHQVGPRANWSVYRCDESIGEHCRSRRMALLTTMTFASYATSSHPSMSTIPVSILRCVTSVR